MVRTASPDVPDDGHGDNIPVSPGISESATSASETLYTPSVSESQRSTQKDLDECDSASETDVLLVSPPPEYEDVVPGTGNATVDVKSDRGSFPQPGDGHRDAEAGGRRARRRGWCGKRRDRDRQRCQMTKWKLFVGIVKFCLLIGLYPRNRAEENDSPPREIEIHKKSGAIWGEYPLYDLLALTTSSGSIAVTIIPQPADPRAPSKPARVFLRSRSGSISVKFQLPAPGSRDADTHAHDKPPALHPRPYEVEIATHSGSIAASIAFSTSVKLSSTSGAIDAHLTPLVFPGAAFLDTHSDNISITTVTRSGSANVVLNDPLIYPRLAPSGRQTRAQHRGPGAIAVHEARGSGSLRVRYPPSWAGRVHAASIRANRVSLGGKGVRVVGRGSRAVDGVKEPDAELPRQKQWWGSRGDMHVDLRARTGAVMFRVGDD
ncbi:predicted protein [Uncinocarpus reesii 1704]|uniref:Uncharacterized protein n=1 Tax=Uncinocarpus reesii (strain UAMH 1704) TaxID=336963 RepID=C4JK99_UNCRE|nr:uncharacterized protein UREG_02056 [Uncinocarpus reesii 1704]EEP77207.1 predicted protein [Uncinocarpus reesii 1704]